MIPIDKQAQLTLCGTSQVDNSVREVLTANEVSTIPDWIEAEAAI